MSLIIAADEAEAVRQFLADRSEAHESAIRCAFIETYGPALAELIKTTHSWEMCEMCNRNGYADDIGHCCMEGVIGYFRENGGNLIKKIDAPLCDNIWDSFVNKLIDSDVPRRAAIMWFSRFDSVAEYLMYNHKEMSDWLVSNYPGK
jgi:hypothetical protein